MPLLIQPLFHLSLMKIHVKNFDKRTVLNFFLNYIPKKNVSIIPYRFFFLLSLWYRIKMISLSPIHNIIFFTFVNFRFHYAARTWDAVKKSQLMAEYNRLLHWTDVFTINWLFYNTNIRHVVYLRCWQTEHMGCSTKKKLMAKYNRLLHWTDVLTITCSLYNNDITMLWMSV